MLADHVLGFRRLRRRADRAATRGWQEAVIDRTFAAVVLDWGIAVVPDRRASLRGVRRRVEALCADGVHIAVVGGTGCAAVDGRLRARPSGPGRLLLGLNRGSELFEVKADGPHLLRRRVASEAEIAALDRASQVLAGTLASRGLDVRVVAAQRDRRRIDLVPEPARDGPAEARIGELRAVVADRLRRCGFTDIGDVVRLGAQLAAQCGLSDARVTSDANYVEIGLSDTPDSMRDILAVLARMGIGPGLVLAVGGHPGPPDAAHSSGSLLCFRQAAAVSGGGQPTGPFADIAPAGGGLHAVLCLLDEQLRRRRKRRVPSVDEDSAWTVRVTGADRLSPRAVESLFTVGAAGFATRGSVEEPTGQSVPLTLAAGTYQGSGPGQHLLPGPRWTGLDIEPAPGGNIRMLDLHTGVLFREEESANGPPMRSLRFASLTLPGVVALRAEASVGRLRAGSPFRPPRDARMTRGRMQDRHWARVGGDGGPGIAAVAWQRLGRDGDTRTVERVAAYVADPRRPPALSGAQEMASAAGRLGFEQVLAKHRAAWAQRWEAVDVRIPDDPAAQLAIRYALFQLWCNTGRHDELAVGARGLSGTGYAGHVFWDADVFVLPALVSIDPAAARAMVRYRLRRLGAAKARARAAGRDGARFPWESAVTGEDVTPLSGHVGGDIVPILTGQQEEHVTADVAWAAVRCAEWTGRSMHPARPVSSLLAETARYWASRCRRDPSGAAHIDGVIGPDEYHESVSDNAFTNVMARWNLRAAAGAAERAGEAGSESREWRQVAESIVDGHDPVTKRYEQFAGYYDLEPLLMEHVAPVPVAADILLGRERVAASQVIKQPDVLMLHHLVPEEVAPGSLRPNLDFYGPRTAHGSSLSPAITASLLARAGRADEALAMLRMALDLDLGDLTGMTAAGLHMATLGGVWQAVLTGFAGVSVSGGLLRVDPRLPTSWQCLQVRFRCLGRRVCVTITPEAVTVGADGPIRVQRAGWQPRLVSGRVTFSGLPESGEMNDA
jgi:Glycosyl hydrolase family 65 central catalytic domain/Glycosyl hydrolase family 65, C-terminal domain